MFNNYAEDNRQILQTLKLGSHREEPCMTCNFSEEWGVGVGGEWLGEGIHPIEGQDGQMFGQVSAKIRD